MSCVCHKDSDIKGRTEEAVARRYLLAQKVLPLMWQRQNAQNNSGKLASQYNLGAFCLHRFAMETLRTSKYLRATTALSYILF